MLTRLDLYLIKDKLPPTLQRQGVTDEEIYSFYINNKDKFPEYNDYELDTEINDKGEVRVVVPESNWAYIYTIDKEDNCRYQVALMTEENGRYLQTCSDKFKSLVYEVCQYLLICKVQQFRIRLVVNDNGLEFHADETDDYARLDQSNYRDKIDYILNKEELELLLYNIDEEHIRDMKRKSIS